MSSPSPETKPEVNPSEPPHTPKKAASKKKTTASPSAKTSLIGSPSKDKAREMKRIALDALFEMGVRGEAANSVAAQSGLTPKQVGDLFRTNRKNMRLKAMAIFDSGGL